MNPKPIFIVKVSSNVDSEWAGEMSLDLQEKLPDYHVLVFQTSEMQEPEFSVLYEKDFTEVKFEELKEIVKNAIANK
jgi:hypothetical protein